MNTLLNLLDWLEENNIYYRLNRVNDNILVEVAIPGERWEIEVLRSSKIQIEKFISTGEIIGELTPNDVFTMLGEQ